MQIDLQLGGRPGGVADRARELVDLGAAGLLTFDLRRARGGPARHRESQPAGPRGAACRDGDGERHRHLRRTDVDGTVQTLALGHGRRWYSPEQVADAETALHHRLLGGADAAGGVRALREKRVPVWTSRISTDWEELPDPGEP